MYHAHGRNQDYAVAREPDAVKVACPVREEVVRNVPQGNALAAYFTLVVDDAHDLSMPHLMFRHRK